jgi:uncharacterized protein DUF2752
MKTVAEGGLPAVEQASPRGRWFPGGTAFWVATAAVPLLVGAVILYCFNPIKSGFYPICLFHASTGLLCPGCGSLRALHQLLHGNLATAVRYNVLCVASIPLVLGISVRTLIRRSREQDASLIIRPVWLWTGFAVTMIFWILRNIPTPLKYWLGP